MTFLPRNDPCFIPGAVWVRTDGTKHETIIRRVEQFGDGPYDYDVHHGAYGSDREYCKDLWNFQVRYMPKPPQGAQDA